MKGKDFIVFSLQPWDFEMGSNAKDIASEMARHNRVLYVNRPIERSTLYKFRNDHKIKSRLRSVKQNEGVLERAELNLWAFNPRVILESINWLPEGKMHHAFNRINARRLARQIHWAVHQLGFKDPILFIDNDFLKGFYLNEYLQAPVMVYYIRDYLRSQAYFQKHGALEPQFIAKADVVVTNSLYLTDYAKQYNTNACNTGQGCNIEAYMQPAAAVPQDIAAIKGPVIGYCGALLETRLDIDLIGKIAQHNHAWQVVLVGPEDEAFKTSVLHQLANVHFLGSKPPEILPAYVQQFDVCINPQLLNQMTIGNYPRKVDEYLAAGKPVVATHTRAMEFFAPHCWLAKDAAEYIFCIEQALATTPSAAVVEDRKTFAAAHTWQASVAAMYNAIEQHKHEHQYEAQAKG